LAIHERIRKEIEENIIRADAEGDGDAQEQQRQAARFKELNSDFNDFERYVGKHHDVALEAPENAAECNKELVNKLMAENVIIVENPNSIIQERKKKKKVESKVEEIMLRQLEQSKIKKRFERMTTLLGITNRQYLALQSFERYYKTRQNYGLEQMEKNQDMVLGKELFACWDPERRGRIGVQDLAENLISFGLSMSLEQVVDLIKALLFKKGAQGAQQVEEITMKEFIKIFERDPFGEKATEIIKGECDRKKEAAAEKIVA
jgi:Ca2+-binding EF-hand superfamily protein